MDPAQHQAVAPVKSQPDVQPMQSTQLPHAVTSPLPSTAQSQPQTQSLTTPLASALQTPLIGTANTTPIPSPGLYGLAHNRSNMALPPAPQAASEGTTPLNMSHSPYLHPLHHKVRETHKALVDMDYATGRKLINHYEIIDELGRGVHGKVKLARNTENGENVAIKIIPRFSKKRRLGKITTRGSHDKVKREIAILKKIRHPNVVALLEVIDDPELKKIYMVLEHVELGEVVWRKKGVPHISQYERRRVEREMHGDPATSEEERYDRLLENRQAVKDRKRAKISQGQASQHEYWSLEYGNSTPDDEELEVLRTRIADERDEVASVARSNVSNPDSTMASRGTSRAPSRTQSSKSISRAATPHPADLSAMQAPLEDDDLGTPGPLRSNPVSSSALEGTMYGAYTEDPALRGRSPSMADSIISHMSSLDYNRVADPFADDFSYVPCFTIDDARRTFRDTVLGLEYLHYEGIIHRDIKPANLLWTRDHKTKISDFGVSYFGRPIRDAEVDDAVSESEAHDFDNDLELAKTVGTPAFFAPELCYTDLDSDLPQPKITEQIDVWSLGVTLYCLIFARIPFLAEDEFQMFRKIATEEVYIPKRRLRPVDPSTKPNIKDLFSRVNGPPYRNDDELAYEEIDPRLHDILARMLTKNPDKRIRLRDVKRHPWVLEGIGNHIAWLDDTDVSRKASGGRIQVDDREMATAVIPLTLLERARSAVKKVYGKVMHSRTPDRGESASRRRAASSAASSSGEGLTNPSTPVSRENRRKSLRGDDYFAAASNHSQQTLAEHPLSHSITATPHESPSESVTPAANPVPLRRDGSGGLSLRQGTPGSSSDFNISYEQSRSPHYRGPRHGHTRSVAGAFLSLTGPPPESYTVPSTPLYDCPTGTSPSNSARQARDAIPTATEGSSRARSVDRGLFASADKRAEPQVALSTAVAPGTVEAPRSARPLRLPNPEVRPARPSLSSPSIQSSFAPHPSVAPPASVQPLSEPNLQTLPIRPGSQQRQPSSGPGSLMRSMDSVSTARPEPTEGRFLQLSPAAIPCPPSPEHDVFEQNNVSNSHLPSRTDTVGMLLSSNSTSLTTLPTPLTSPSETTSPVCANSVPAAHPPKDRDIVEHMLAFQSDPSLPALLSGASSVSADLEGEFLGGPGAVVKPSLIDTTDSLTPPAIEKNGDDMPVPGSPLEQQDLASEGEGAIAVEIDSGVAKAPVSLGSQSRPRTLSDLEDYEDDNGNSDSDSDEGLIMAKSRKRSLPARSQLSPRGSPSGGLAERAPVARRRDTNISIASTETAKKVGVSD